MLDIAIIVIPLATGLGLYTFLRQRQIQPVLSGLAAVFVSFVVIASLFAVLLTTGNV